MFSEKITPFLNQTSFGNLTTSMEAKQNVLSNMTLSAAKCFCEEIRIIFLSDSQLRMITLQNLNSHDVFFVNYCEQAHSISQKLCFFEQSFQLSFYI